MRSLEKLREWRGKKMRFQTTLEGAECLRCSDAGCKVFQACGSATKNAQSPIVVRHEDGVTRADVDVDRSLFLVSTSATRRSSLARYDGAVPCRHRKTRTESLNFIRSGTHSQWRSRSSGVMCSYRCFPGARERRKKCVAVKVTVSLYGVYFKQEYWQFWAQLWWQLITLLNKL